MESDMPWCRSDRTRGNEYELKHRKLHLKIRKSFFSRKGDRVLEQVSRRGCGVSILGDNENLIRYSPNQPAVPDPAWAGWLDQMISRGACQPQPFCESTCQYLWWSNNVGISCSLKKVPVSNPFDTVGLLSLYYCKPACLTDQCFAKKTHLCTSILL